MMLKLIKLEWKKNNIGKHIRDALILTGVLCLFLFALAFLGIANDPDTGVPDAAPGNNTISAPIELFTSMAFLVFTGIMLSAFIVSAYKNKTINIMFSYPIKRQKILVAQMLAVWIFGFAALVTAKLTAYGCIVLGSRFMESAFPIDFDMTGGNFYIQVLAKSFVTVTMSFIALFVGLAMKSSKAVIVTSFLLIVLTLGNVGDFTMADNTVFPVVLTTVSLICGCLSLQGIERRDVM